MHNVGLSFFVIFFSAARFRTASFDASSAKLDNNDDDDESTSLMMMICSLLV